MLSLARLPRFTFRTEAGETALELSACGPRIQALADRVAERFPAGAPVGLIFPSGPTLVLAWLAVLHAGRTPCILQYPTEKLSRDYWRNSLAHTLRTMEIQGLLHGPDLDGHEPASLGACLRVEEVAEEVPFRGDFPTAGTILQFSSGTTGQKKGVVFTFEALRAHAAAYNAVLALGPADTLASWLPLYHDMGFVACFLMPLMLGVPVVMMDPITWVRQPGRLFDAITDHGATLCYLPNFAFEVLSHHAEGRTFPTMRHWISCSEPAYLETMQRFQQATQADPRSLSVCYAMAENVFAVTQSAGLVPLEGEGRTHLSCGAPIPGTQVKVVDDEVWVRSAHSLRAYVGSEDARDAEGYYATGDLGFLHGGELVLTGRKRDLLNLAGRKYMLNDLDLALAKVFPASAGRIASLARFDPEWGTERPLFLVEQEDFWAFRMDATTHQALKDAVGLEVFECEAVPPRFITKTSSGKINRRKTLDDWTALKSARPGGTAGPTASIEADFDHLFGPLPAGRPLAEFLDSMGHVELRLFCEDHGLPFRPELDRRELLAARPPAVAQEARVFTLLALMDGIKLGPPGSSHLFPPEFIRRLEAALGGPVRVEHMAVPPAPILWSDLVFHDYFMPRAMEAGYSAFAACMAKLKGASLVIVDDEDNFRLPLLCAYPQLDHQFARAQVADFLAHRFMRYTLKHDQLPRKVVIGAEIQPHRINPALDALEGHLRRPLFRVAFHEAYRPFTQGWSHQQYRPYVSDADYQQRPVDAPAFQEALLAFIHRHRDRMVPGVAEPSPELVMPDPPHFCSFLVNPATVQWAVNRFERFCILGLPSSVPYLTHALRALGKPYHFSPTRVLDEAAFDCVVMTGASGLPETARPIVEFVHATEAFPRVRNLPFSEARECPFAMVGVPETLKGLQAPYWDAITIGNYFLNGGKCQFPAEWWEPVTAEGTHGG